MFLQPKQHHILSRTSEKSSSNRGNALGFPARNSAKPRLPTELHPDPSCSYFSSFPSMHHPLFTLGSQTAEAAGYNYTVTQQISRPESPVIFSPIT